MAPLHAGCKGTREGSCANVRVGIYWALGGGFAIKTLARIAALLLAVGINRTTARASTTNNTVESYGDTSEFHPSLCDAVPGNLVENCGFETGRFYPWWTGAVCFCAITERARGSGQFGVEYGGPFLGDLWQVVPTMAGQKYALSFWLRNTGQPSAFQVFWDAALVYELVDAPDFPWTPISLEGLIASHDGTTLRFGFYNKPYWWFIDDIVVVPYCK